MIAPLLLLLGGHPAPAPSRPKLVVVITVDQMRADYLDRWKTQFTGGFAGLTLNGAVFSNAFQDHAVTETAPGHASILSGRWPAHTGIVRNAEGVQDPDSPLLSGAGDGASPKRFRGTAFFDWLHQASPDSRALSVSRKDRAAILPLGKAKENVYWYAGGAFTTSKYYADSLPAWVKTFNAARFPQKAAGYRWTLLLPDTAYPEQDNVPYENGGRDFTFPHVLPRDSTLAAQAVVATPLMDSLELAFALAGTEALRLGKRGVTDLLAVSLSATDAVGHAYGPDSRELHDQVLHVDRYLGWFLNRLDDRYGRDNVLVVLVSDHGMSSFPQYARGHGFAEAREVTVDSIVAEESAAIDRLTGATAPRHWLSFESGILFLDDNGGLAARGVNQDSIFGAIAQHLKAIPGVARVDRVADLPKADTADDAIARRWVHQLPANSGAVLVITLQDANVWAGYVGAKHGQPSDRDTHIPLIISGRGIKPGTYTDRADAVDIAPTLARLLGITPLSFVDGRVLTEALDPRN
ncbi:MAG TPA: alkaline phosphatase family protein [Gemmatimonadales bacterium]